MLETVLFYRIPRLLLSLDIKLNHFKYGLAFFNILKFCYSCYCLFAGYYCLKFTNISIKYHLVWHLVLETENQLAVGRVWFT